jgi:hypothetical protein
MEPEDTLKWHLWEVYFNIVPYKRRYFWQLLSLNCIDSGMSFTYEAIYAN